MCRRIRLFNPSIGILILTGRTDLVDRVEGLDAGADDYLTKPFESDELSARVRALVRRRVESDESEAIDVGGIRIDLASRTASRDATELHLTRTEFDLLELFARNHGIVLSKSVIYDRGWGHEFDESSKNLEVYVGYLRRKLEVDGRSRVIHTVRGIGYRFTVADSSWLADRAG